MAKEPRPKGYPKLKNYKPSQFMLPTSHYDKKKADRAVTFIENLCHTKGKWAGTPFWLLPWQEQLIRDIFGIVKPDGNRQFRTAFVEICKKVGKSELAAAIALYLLYADNEPSAEVYGAAAESNPFCVKCYEEGHITMATVVDHIKPHRGDQKLFWDRGNWQPLCEHHHNVKTMTEDRYVEYKF